MKIELKNREHWIKVIDYGLRYIINEKEERARIRRDKITKYDKLPWYKKVINNDRDIYFVDWTYDKERWHLTELLECLITDNIGTIYIDYKELDALRFAEEKYKGNKNE